MTLGDVTPGAFVAAVGADNPEKQEIGRIVAGLDSAPPGSNRVTVFDSTGMALQDVAAAAAVYERAQAMGRGTVVQLAG